MLKITSVLNCYVSVLPEMDSSGSSTKKRRKAVGQVQRDAPEGNSILVKHKVKLQQTNGFTAGNEQKRKSTKQVHSPSPKMKVKVKKRISVPDEDQCQTEESFSSAASSKISAVSSDSFNGEITSSVTAMKSPKKRRKSKQSLPEPDESWEKAVERARGMPDGALGGADVAGDGGEDGSTQKIKKAGDKVKKIPLNVSYNLLFFCASMSSVCHRHQCVTVISVSPPSVCHCHQCVTIISVSSSSVCHRHQCVIIISVSSSSVCHRHQCNRALLYVN